jgi:alkylation response protein AidB-like acyl-CoA dehydrogenase
MITDVELTPGQQAFREEVEAWTRENCRPEHVAECDEKGEPPLDLYPKLAEKGWLAIGLPAEWGGFGGAVEIAILMEELDRSFIQLGSLVSRGAIYPCGLLLHYGTGEQRQRWIPKIVAGEVRSCVGISEPQAGSDAASLATRAEPDGNGGWVVNGEKLYLSGLHYSTFVLLAARTDPDAPKHSGVTVFMVDCDSPGIEATRLKTLGAWQNSTYHAWLRDVRVPGDRVLGQLHNGWKVLGGHLERERMILCARAVGAARAVLDQAVAYAREREQFGKPLAEFQVIQHKLADIAIELHVARAATYELARKIQAGRDCRVEANLVKVFASEMLVRAADAGLQVMGGQGYLRSSDMQRQYRDARLLTIGGGTSEVLRNVVARALLKQPR